MREPRGRTSPWSPAGGMRDTKRPHGARRIAESGSRSNADGGRGLALLRRRIRPVHPRTSAGLVQFNGSQDRPVAQPLRAGRHRRSIHRCRLVTAVAIRGLDRELRHAACADRDRHLVDAISLAATLVRAHAAIGLMLTTMIVFFVFSRYRLPAVPLMTIFAGAALAAAPWLLWDRRRRNLTARLPDERRSTADTARLTATRPKETSGIRSTSHRQYHLSGAHKRYWRYEQGRSD